MREQNSYAGFCAGAYLGGADKCGIRLLDIASVNAVRKGKHGDLHGMVCVSSPTSNVLLMMDYHNGPVYDFSLPQGVQCVGIVARVDEELRCVRGKMREKPCIVRGKHGRGHVLLCGPHPERTDGLEEWTYQLLLSVARK